MYSEYKTSAEFMEACGYEINGQWYPRVTKIVEIKAKPALYRFYGEAASYAAAKAITEESAKEGTLIHETVEGYLLGKNPVVPDSIRPAFDAFVEFLNQKSIQVLPEYVEKRVHSPEHRYAGTTDALALIDGRFGVLDIKTSQAIYRDYSLQTSAYMDPLSKELPSLETRWILRIDQVHDCKKCNSTMRPKGGRNKIRKNWQPGNWNVACPEDQHEWNNLKGVIEIKEFPHWQEDFQAFLSAKKLWEWENEYWLRQVGYLK